ncbi:outer membrane protein TolC [Elusimicrobium simillimum]|uniref:TolC family protein n=1 Tax=Elusimicrobium simillimum TaxID=3143438 RepID=UPI003C6F1E42
MKKAIFTLLILPLALAVSAQDATQDVNIPLYSVDKCIEIALEKNPTLAAAHSNLLGAKAKVWQSGSVFFPQISASGGWSRSRTEVLDDVFSYGNKVNAGVSASLAVFSFGKDYLAFRAQQLSYTSSDYTYQDTLNKTVYDVKEAYYNLVYAIKSVEVYKTSVQQYEQQLAQAQSFYKVGIRSKIDVTNAEVNLNNAKLNLIKAYNNVKTSYATLNSLMGLKKLELYSVDDDLESEKYEISAEYALTTAYQNRPDLAAAVAKTEASKATLNAQRTNYLPEINASASYGVSGSTSLSRENGSVGLSASWSIFNGLSTTKRVEELKATFMANQYTQEAVRQSIMKDLTQAYANLTQAEEAIPVSKLNVEKAKENLELANGRYKVGIGNSIEVKDAESSYSEAELSYAKSLADYQIAKAYILKSMGKR